MSDHTTTALAACRHGLPYAAYVKGYGTPEHVAEMVWGLKPGETIRLSTVGEARVTVQVCELCAGETPLFDDETT